MEDVADVLAPPADLSEVALVAALRQWGLSEPRLVYLPVGFGAHHWRAECAGRPPTFVTVDELAAGFRREDDVDAAFAALERAYGTAAALRDEAGLEFVLAPLPDREGFVVRRLGGGYAVSVAPFLDGTSRSFGAYESGGERRRMAELVGRLHAAGTRIRADLPRRDDCSIPSRSVLADALATLDEPWRSGPFADQARALLARHDESIQARLRGYDVLAERVRDRAAPWVVTHGEPHRANVIADELGALRLVDWDTTLVAPRERDLCMILDEELTGWSEYAAVVGDVALDPQALALYREWWELADIAAFVALFRRPHEKDDNTVVSFELLRSNLEGAA